MHPIMIVMAMGPATDDAAVDQLARLGFIASAIDVAAWSYPASGRTFDAFGLGHKNHRPTPKRNNEMPMTKTMSESNEWLQRNEKRSENIFSLFSHSKTEIEKIPHKIEKNNEIFECQTTSSAAKNRKEREKKREKKYVRHMIYMAFGLITVFFVVFYFSSIRWKFSLNFCWVLSWFCFVLLVSSNLYRVCVFVFLI